MSVTYASLVQLNHIFRPPTQVLDAIDQEGRVFVLQGFDLATIGIAQTFSFLDPQIQKLAGGIDATGRMSLGARARFMWGESDLRTMMQELRDQRDALGHLIACLQLSKTVDIEEKLRVKSPGLDALNRTASRAKDLRRSEVPQAQQVGNLSEELKPILVRRSTLLDMEEKSSTTGSTWSSQIPPSTATAQNAPGGRSFSNPSISQLPTHPPSSPQSPASSPNGKQRVHHGLHLAVADNVLGQVQFLMSTGSDPLALPINPYGSLHNSNKNPFCLATYMGRIEILDYFLQQGYASAINDVATNDLPPLLAASWSGHVNIVFRLIQCGANVRLQGSKNNTSLFWASARGHVNVARILVDNGAGLDINLANAQGLTPLVVAAQHGRTEVVRYLISVGADVSASNKKQQTAMHLAAHGGHTDTIRVLLTAKAPVQNATSNGKTPLMFASAAGYADVIDTLVRAGASPDLQEIEDCTALYYASMHGHTAAVEMLLSHHALTESHSRRGDRALHIAAEKGHASIVGVLLDAGADLAALRFDGLDALDIACHYDRADIIAPLLIYRAARDPATTQEALYTAVCRGLDETVDVLVEAGADVNFTDGAGQSVLARAIRESKLDAVVALIAKGSSVTSTDRFGATPLHRAARLGNVEIAAELVNRGADLERGDKGGHTALHVACIYASPDMVRFLVEHDADLESLSEEKKTPIILAGEHKRADVVQVLFESGACVGPAKNDSKVLFTADSSGLIEINLAAVLERLNL
jgi:ankyrin repeat protein